MTIQIKTPINIISVIMVMGCESHSCNKIKMTDPYFENTALSDGETLQAGVMLSLEQ